MSWNLLHGTKKTFSTKLAHNWFAFFHNFLIRGYMNLLMLDAPGCINNSLFFIQTDSHNLLKRSRSRLEKLTPITTNLIKQIQVDTTKHRSAHNGCYNLPPRESSFSPLLRPCAEELFSLFLITLPSPDSSSLSRACSFGSSSLLHFSSCIPLVRYIV